VPELRPAAAALWAEVGLRPEAAVWVGVVLRRVERDAAVLPRAALGALGAAQPSVGLPSAEAWVFRRDQAQD
jgi:hypothetical protein